MAKEKKYGDRYWETEKGETIEFGNFFMRCYDKSGKLQFGVKSQDKKTGEDVFLVKFVLDRKDFFSSDEAPGYLRTLLEDWEQVYEDERND